MIHYFKNNWGHVGLLHNIQGYQGHQNVSKCSPHHNEDICTIRGNNLKTSFSHMSQNVVFLDILGYLGSHEGVFNDRTGPILLSSYPLTHIYVHVKLGNNLILKKFLGLNPKYDKNILPYKNTLALQKGRSYKTGTTVATHIICI